MSAAVNMEIIKDAILTGIKEAWEDYYNASNGEWLWNAPEYFITVKIRDAILDKCNKHCKKMFITLEDNVEYILTESCSKGKGRIPGEIRKDGRFDVVVWWASGWPRGIIEVKHRYDLDKIDCDLKGIGKILHKAKMLDDSSLQFGIFAFYTDYYHEKGKSSDFVKKRIENIYERANEIAETEKIQIYYYKLGPVKKEKSSWGAAVYLFKK